MSETNLQRQILFREADIGQKKALVAAQHLQALNAQTQFEAVTQRLNPKNAHELINRYDWIVDCTDNFLARYLINDVCVELNKTWVFGAVQGFEGQIGVCNYLLSNGLRTATYRCIFPTMANVPSCEELGVAAWLRLMNNYQ